jgi:hypothetical protein
VVLIALHPAAVRLSVATLYTLSGPLGYLSGLFRRRAAAATPEAGPGSESPS